MVEPGNLLCIAEPFAHVLSNKEHGDRCENCMKRVDDLKRCSACASVKYCSTKCQRNDWSIHKKECPCLKRFQPKIPTDSTRLLLRLVIRCNDFSVIQETTGVLKMHRSFNDLMSHEKEIVNDKIRSEQLSHHLFTLQKITSGILDLPSSCDLLKIFGKMTTNSFTICGEEMQPIGVGIYLGPSLLDHRCAPNAVGTFQGKSLHLRAVTAISDPSPSNVFISYIDQLDSTAERNRSLMEQYFFKCDCVWCRDKALEKAVLAIKCPQENCTQGYISTFEDESSTVSSCSDCGKSVNEDFIRKAARFMEKCQGCLKEAKKAKESNDAERILSVCEKCLQQNRNFLHPLNLNYVKILDCVFDAAVDLQFWDKAILFGTQTLPAYRKYYPPYSPNVGIQLLKLGKIHLYLHNLKEALTFLQQANDILLVTHGREHVLYSQLLELLDQTREEMRTELEFGS
uniref:Histone-lysine N-methyltransferase SMYD3-like n=1 Tax=Crassostrea virginica TaxID=6565 RepID=A0A8B8D556_CRAVI|nr:histone-lysine N-methyltransferase SMYD3-like [Crassostrea virginica]